MNTLHLQLKQQNMPSPTLPKPTPTYYLTLIFATFFMGSSFIASKILLLDKIPPFTLVGWRFIVAALTTLPIVYLTQEPQPKNLSPANRLTTALIGLLQTGGTMGLLFLAMLYISAANAAILLFTNPLWVALLSHFALHEKLTTLKITGLIIGITGVVLCIGLGSAAADLKGEFLGLASSLCWASTTIVHKKYKTGLGVWRLSFWQMFTGGAVLVLCSLFANETIPANAFTSSHIGWFLWLAIPASTGSFGLWFLALRQGGRLSPALFYSWRLCLR